MAPPASGTIIPGAGELHKLEEAYNILGISPNNDGTFSREIKIPMVPPTPKINPTAQNRPPFTLSKDISIRPGLTLRLYKPVTLPPGPTKLPLVIYAHGGDFVLFSASTVIFHDFCNHIAAQFPAIVASVEYRLAPENRLPAAYDDFVDAILWAQSHGQDPEHRDTWLEHADFTRVFLLGSSSGGNIVYNSALRVSDIDLSPLRIEGILLNQPYFCGVEKTLSETELEDDKMVPLYLNYVLWSLALPLGADRDHEFCNPIKGASDSVCGLPRVFIRGCTGDPLVDRGRELAERLKGDGVSVVLDTVDGGFHGIELMEKDAAQDLYNAMKNFISSTG